MRVLLSTEENGRGLGRWQPKYAFMTSLSPPLLGYSDQVKDSGGMGWDREEVRKRSTCLENSKQPISSCLLQRMDLQILSDHWSKLPSSGRQNICQGEYRLTGRLLELLPLGWSSNQQKDPGSSSSKSKQETDCQWDQDEFGIVMTGTSYPDLPSHLVSLALMEPYVSFNESFGSYLSCDSRVLLCVSKAI